MPSHERLILQQLACLLGKCVAVPAAAFHRQGWASRRPDVARQGAGCDPARFGGSSVGAAVAPPPRLRGFPSAWPLGPGTGSTLRAVHPPLGQRQITGSLRHAAISPYGRTWVHIAPSYLSGSMSSSCRHLPRRGQPAASPSPLAHGSLIAPVGR